jgi:hypothetical protein
MLGFGPTIHVFFVADDTAAAREVVDARDEHGHDGGVWRKQRASDPWKEDIPML